MLLCALVVSGASADSGVNYCVAPNAQAATPQVTADANACIAPDAITAAQTACDSIKAGQVCLGVGDVQSTPANSLAVVGTTVDFSSVDSLTGMSGSLALLKMQADLPDSAAPIQLVLFGDASIANAYTGPQQPFPSVTLTNTGLNILNLRATPSLTGTVVGTVKPNDTLTADGRSSDGLWLRVQRDAGAAWIYASLITVKEGDDASKLYAVDSPITQHLQSMTLESSTENCAGGLLVEAANNADAHLEVNGVLLTFSNATLLLQAQADKTLTVQVAKGSVDVDASGESVTAKMGAQASVALTGSQASAAPELSDHSAFASLVNSPLSLLPAASLTCIAGVRDGTAALYRTPGASTSSGQLGADSSAVVTGQIQTSDGKTWLLVGSNWVLMDDVQLAGVCSALPTVSASAAQQTQSSAPPAASFAHDLVPDGRSIWAGNTSADTETGVCIGPPNPPRRPCSCACIAAIAAKNMTVARIPI